MGQPELKLTGGKASDLLQKKREKLIHGFLKKREPEFTEKYAHILDDYFRDSFESSAIGPRLGINKNPYAIIAQGGYGREEQCLHSDVDLLFLFKKRIPRQADDLIREILYPLWDIGFDIGHATRTIKDCISLGGKDFEVLTSIMDARFVCGISPLYTDLMDQLRAKVILKKSKKIIAWLVETNRERHERFGDSTFLLEPNLKEGQGGLRDYHTMLWIARIKSNLRRPRDLEYHGYLSYEEFRHLEEALAFIWNVRSLMHHLAERRCDQVYFEYQTELAKALKFKKEGGQQPVERFLGKLHGQMEFLKQQHLMFLYEQGYAISHKPRARPTGTPVIEGLDIIDNRINFSSPGKILAFPELLIKIFGESARFKIPLSSEANRLITEFAYLVDDDFSTSAQVIKSFERILISPPSAFNVLNEMLRTGFLERFIPEIKGIVNRIQYDEYHLYPVDKHSLRTVQAIKRFGTGEDETKEPLYGELYKGLKNRRLLLWAALLHDIGKGEPGGGHSRRGAKTAGDILAKKGYGAKGVETVSFLVEEHLFLVKIATRRDINDEETAIFCARRIKDIERLKMLYLLTVADSISTGPKAWNEWTATLLKDLFFKISSILKNGELATSEAVETIRRKKDEVLASARAPEAREELEGLFNVMSPRYRLNMPAEDILKHIKLFKGLEGSAFIWKTVKDSSNTRAVTVCAKDSPGLFSKIAGVFTLNGFDILDTQVFTWRNNTALDIFRVKAPVDRIFEEERWVKAEKNLKAALSGELDLSAALKEKMSAYRAVKPRAYRRPHRVVVDNKSSSFFTIIEVFAHNFPGLLFSVTDAIFRCGFDIWVAKIATKIDQVVDVFYIRDFDGQKVDASDQVKTIKEKIMEVLSG